MIPFNSVLLLLNLQGSKILQRDLITKENERQALVVSKLFLNQRYYFLIKIRDSNAAVALDIKALTVSSGNRAC